MGKQCLHQFFLAESTYRLPEDAPALGSLIREELKKIKKGWFGHSQWDFIQASLSAENRLKKLEIKVIKYQCALCGEVRKHDLP